ncbi:MAG TPA: cytochrome c/FTR1 family iron permease, partial [Burkholderiaceae bacterium]|nr:cytochrome c/FTR1 family iron permease [Burkholderiaceae bacterium]
LDFVGQAITSLEGLPDNPARAPLLDKARALLAQVQAKAAGDAVSASANQLKAGVIAAYQLTMAPRTAPKLADAARLYNASCASCHGADGRGDGPAAKGLDPAPANFHDADRMRVRSLYGLYNTVTLGVSGTAMRGYKELSDDERWMLTFHLATMRQTPEALAQAEAAWKRGHGQKAFSALKDLVGPSPAEVQAQHGADAVPALAWLTAHPEALSSSGPSPLAFARGKLDESAQLYARGDNEGARQAAIAAYLEGFELVESSLDNVDAPLRMEVEREMMALRSAIGSAQAVDAVHAQVGRIHALLDRAQEKLSGDGLAPATAFFSSLLILLREGLEAILVLAAIIAFVRKTGRREAMPWIHAGWLGAVALGVVTWYIAERVITISGANRELTEGITALVASAMLLYVGYWLHSKSYAHAWQHFIRDQVNAALGKGTVWALAGVSFLAVYREAFEIVLFYQALWVQAGESGRQAVLAGVAVAAVLLAALAWAILKYTVRLPIGPFFAVTAWLLALLAVVFAGHGVAALQEAGVLDARPFGHLSIPLLGVHPTLQGMGAQVVALTLVLLGVWMTRRASSRAVA